MKNFITSFFNKKLPNTDFDNISCKANDSSKAMIEAASGTASMAQDVAEILKSKIDDYITQINSTSKLLTDALLILDASGNIQSSNAAVKGIFGYDESDILHGSVLKLLPVHTSNPIEYLKESVKDSFPAQVPFFDTPAVTKDGNQIHVAVSISELPRSDGSINYLLLIRDITQRVEATRRIQESEQHFRSFGETSSEAMMIYNQQRLLDWNDNLKTLTGYSDNELKTIKPSTFISELNRSDVNNIYFGSMSNCYETLFTTKQGHSLAVSINSREILWHGEKARIKVIRDISSYKELEMILRSSRERYRCIVDNTTDLVCRYNKDLVITFCNKSFWEYFDVEKNDPIGRDLCDFFPQDDFAVIEQALLNLTVEKPFRRSLHKVRHNDVERWQDWIDVATFNEQGEIIEYQSVSRDVTNYVNR